MAIAVFFTSGPSIAVAQNLASQTIETCSAATKLDAEFLAGFESMGWTRVSFSDANKFSTIFSDGVAAATVDGRTEPNDWPHTLPLAQKFATLVFNGSFADPPTTTVLLDKNGKAALAVYKDKSYPDLFRCFYSGPSDAELDETLALLSQLDDRTGWQQGTPGVQLATIDNINGDRRISTQIARFVRSMTGDFGREARVELGFSLFNTPIGTPIK